MDTGFRATLWRESSTRVSRVRMCEKIGGVLNSNAHRRVYIIRNQEFLLICWQNVYSPISESFKSVMLSRMPWMS